MAKKFYPTYNNTQYPTFQQRNDEREMQLAVPNQMGPKLTFGDTTTVKIEGFFPAALELTVRWGGTPPADSAQVDLTNITVQLEKWGDGMDVLQYDVDLSKVAPDPGAVMYVILRDLATNDTAVIRHDVA